MTEIGTVIDGKYEILKQIGKGGMSIVYLAMDKHLNKQWAVKEIRKRGNGKNDEVVVNSLLAEANLMKRLDHPALPRIVDIIDNGVTIYVVMDYIEGESLDKILAEFGAQSEELVITWAKQLCDALSYLHSQKPSIIYRDMKPANIMLKPEGNIKIIDFGIAREYKEQNLADTTVLGTKGYAPPEQYSGQTDPRSDIFALGMTMHHLLTGIDPRNGEPYAPVRAWNPNLSEGIELIIDKCVEPAAENRYQSCADLLYDLEHPELITSGYKKKQKKKLWAFLISSILCVVMAVVGVIFTFSAINEKASDYNLLLASSNYNDLEKLIEANPTNIEPYQRALQILKDNPKQTEIKNFSNNLYRAISNKNLDPDNSEIAKLCYDTGKLSIVYDEDENRFLGTAKNLLKIASESNADFDGKRIAHCYNTMCSVASKNGKASNVIADDFRLLFDEYDTALDIVKDEEPSEVDYNCFTLYITMYHFINIQEDNILSCQIPKETVTLLLRKIETASYEHNPTNPEAISLKAEIDNNIETVIENFGNKFDQSNRY